MSITFIYSTALQEKKEDGFEEKADFFIFHEEATEETESNEVQADETLKKATETLKEEIEKKEKALEAELKQTEQKKEVQQEPSIIAPKQKPIAIPKEVSEDSFYSEKNVSVVTCSP